VGKCSACSHVCAGAEVVGESGSALEQRVRRGRALASTESKTPVLDILEKILPGVKARYAKDVEEARDPLLQAVRLAHYHLGAAGQVGAEFACKTARDVLGNALHAFGEKINTGAVPCDP
jgi:hypothetical protein